MNNCAPTSRRNCTSQRVLLDLVAVFNVVGLPCVLDALPTLTPPPPHPLGVRYDPQNRNVGKPANISDYLAAPKTGPTGRILLETQATTTGPHTPSGAHYGFQQGTGLRNVQPGQAGTLLQADVADLPSNDAQRKSMYDVCEAWYG